MGGTPPQPVSTETEDAVAQTEPQTLAEVAEATSSELGGVWFAIRNGQKQYLGEVENTNGQPYATTSGWGPFGPHTYFYGAQAEAQEVVQQGGEGMHVVPVNVRCSVED